MDARPTPEQRELDDAASRLADKLGVGAVGDLDDADRRTRLGAALDQAGWRELRSGTPDEPWASGVEVTLVARRLARHACDVAYIGPVLAHDLLRRTAADADAPTLAVSLDLQGLAPGERLAVDAAGARHAIGLIDRAVTRFDLDGHEPAPTVDLTRPVVRLGDAAGAAVGRLDADAVTAWEALAVTLTAADLGGAMEGATTLATEYAKERRQYGAPIGSFQAVQHLLAEARTLTEGALSAMIHAAWAVDALPPPEARRAAAVAKAYAARNARTVCETAIQVHGGIGNTWECMAHVFLRRSILATELFGGDGAQLSLLARERWGANT